MLLVWIMCAGGVVALRHGQHPRVTALVRRLPPSRRAAVDRGLRLVLIGLLLWRSSAVHPADRAERRANVLPASGLSGAWISAVLPVALLADDARARWSSFAREGLRVWRDGASFIWSLGAAGGDRRVGR